MVKYITVATALKLFSSSSMMKQLYRALGNRFGKRKRLKSKMPDYYVNRVNRMLRLNQRYGLVRNNDTIIEVGTGWCHWEAITLKLFFDVKGILFDVWDNRQFEVFRSYLTQLKDSLVNIDIDEGRAIAAKKNIDNILAIDSFDKLYQVLGFKYVIEPRGRLSSFKDESFDLILSGGVLEHIEKNELCELTKEFYRLLKPGGFSIHSVNLTDHLYLYDKKVSPKNYLKFSDKMWKYLFENEIQYFNRVQRPEWLDLFSESGFELIDEDSEYVDIGTLKVNKKYASIGKKDLGCLLLNLVHRKMIS